jgi:2-hydroxycyclohexanecarboxyl-CoA dehydrogenase
MMVPMDLKLGGSIAVVTGGASGIGLACAQALAREGCWVAVWDRSDQAIDTGAALGRDHNVPSMGIQVDNSDYQSLQDAVVKTEAELGPIVHVVHAAAMGSGKFGYPFTNLEPADWPRVIEINVQGTTNVAHAVVPGMIGRKQGTLVFISSVAGQIGSQTDPPYSASKAANINFAQCMAKDLAPHGIRVNTVCPGMVQTPLNKAVWQAWNEQQPASQKRSYEDWAGDKVRSVAPLARWQQPDDVADMVVFLSSERTREVTGQTINVDGGQVMHW